MLLDSALLQTAQIAKLPSPDKSDLEFLRGWLIGEKEGNGFLQGSEVFTWDLPDGTELEQRLFERDLMSLFPEDGQRDPFSNQLTSRILDFYHVIIGSRSKVEYSQDSPSRCPT